MKKTLSSVFRRPLSLISFWAIAAIIKMVLVLLIGFHYEQDTPRYLLNIRGLYNPPLYSIVLRIITTLYPNFYFVILSQTCLFVLIIAFFSRRIQQSTLKWALFWGFEPFSTFYCSDLMSEWLFIAILFAAFAEWKRLHRAHQLRQMVLWNACAFALYLTRYVGLTFFVFTLLYESLNPQLNTILKKLKFITLNIAIFFILSLPIRLLHLYTFNTFKINAYSILNLWNSVSVLYPNSQTQKDPQTPFELYLTSFPDSIFSTHNALMTNQMWQDNLPAYSFAKKHHLSPAQLEDAIQKTCYRLIREESWLRYLTQFVIPNFLKPFQLHYETLGIEVTYRYLKNFFGDHVLPQFVYRSEWIGALFLLCVMNFLKDRTHFLNGYLLFYLLSIFFTSAFFMRYGYAIMPFAIYAFIELFARPLPPETSISEPSSPKNCQIM